MTWAARQTAATVAVLATGIVLAVGHAVVFPVVPPEPWALGAGLLPVAAGAGVVLVGRLAGDVVNQVARPLFAGASAVYLGAVGDTVGVVVVRPPVVRVLAGTVPLTLGAAAVTVAVVRWVGVARRRRELLLDRERRARAQRGELERQADRLEAFAGVVSHDLRNPLEVARVRLEHAQTHVDEETDSTDGDETDGTTAGDGAAEEGIRADLDAVDDSLDRMEEIVDDALALARIGPAALDPTTVSLAAVARTAWDGVATGEATLTVTTETVVVADETYLRRLFENLFRNAAEHAGPTPTVTVAATESSFRVDDDGPGIPPEHREEVTEAGHTTATGGTGFGLSIVAEIAAAHGWQLSVDASETGGARFAFAGVETESADDASESTTTETSDWAGGVREE